MPALPRFSRVLLWSFVCLAATPQGSAAVVAPTWYHPGPPGPSYRYATCTPPPVPAEFTVELWFRGGPQTHSVFPVLCQKPAGIMLNGEATYAFILIASNGHLIFRTTTDAGSYQIEYLANLLDNQWHHIAGVRTADSTPRIFLYVDGRPYGHAPVSGTALTSSEPLGIGALQFTGFVGNYFDGAIDELRLWGAARTPIELERDRQREVSRAPGLLAAFHFDDVYRSETGIVGHFGTAAVPFLTTLHPALTPNLESLPSPPPLSPGEGIEPHESFQLKAARLFTDARYLQAVPLPEGRIAAVAREVGSNNYSLEILRNLHPGVENLGAVTIAPLQALATQGDSVFLATRSGTADQLLGYDVTNPAAPVAISGPAIPFQPRSMIFDPQAPGRLWVGGPDLDGSLPLANYMYLVNPSNAFQSFLQKDLGSSDDVGLMYDFGVSTDLVLISFNDGFLRSYLHTVSGDPPVHGLLFGNDLYLGAPAQVAGIPGTEHFVVAMDDVIFVLDPWPAPSIIVASRPLDLHFVAGLTVTASHAYVVGADGLRVFNLYPNYLEEEVARFASDDTPSRDPSFDADLQQAYVSADQAGLYLLAMTPAVAAPRQRPAPPLVSLRAYPNPVRGAATLTLQLPRSGHARLDLFDVTGRRVRQLAAREFPEGESRLAWDGRDDLGQEVAPGVYFYRAMGQGWSETMRLVRLQ